MFYSFILSLIKNDLLAYLISKVINGSQILGVFMVNLKNKNNDGLFVQFDLLFIFIEIREKVKIEKNATLESSQCLLKSEPAPKNWNTWNKWKSNFTSNKSTIILPDKSWNCCSLYNHCHVDQ